jgi:hypothetical protein
MVMQGLISLRFLHPLVVTLSGLARSMPMDSRSALITMPRYCFIREGVIAAGDRQLLAFNPYSASNKPKTLKLTADR